jgi:hypothetical protein
MLLIPTKEPLLVRFANELIEICMSSSAARAAQARLINQIVETGRLGGDSSKMNLLYDYIHRFQSYLFSPTDLRFMLDFENEHPKIVYERANVVARALTRDWEKNNIDIEFGQGVFEGAKYGASILKQWTEVDGIEQELNFCKRLVAPWSLGVYMEDEISLHKQPVICERMLLSLPEVWRRIHRFPGAKDLLKRIRAHARKGESEWDNTSYFHQVLSTSTINTSGVEANARVPPGGIVNLGNNPDYGMQYPQVQVDRVVMHELWVQDENDYTTIQVIEPDILITPFHSNGVIMKKTNLLIPGETHSGVQPYSLIQPIPVSGYIWGRPAIADLIQLQGLITRAADDADRLLGVQIDKIIGFSGVDGLTDERFDQMRGSGWISAPSGGGTMQDLTPKFPETLLPLMKAYIDQFNQIGGFSDLLQGKGESGVRAGNHASTLLKTGSPRLRNISLGIERQCAMAAETTLMLKTAKDGDRYWTKGDTIDDINKTSFLLTDLPDDRRVAVDSHSSSPIFADDHKQEVAFGAKMGWVSGEDGIDYLSLPNKEKLKLSFREREKAKAEQIKQLQAQDPDAAAKLMSKGGARR